MVPKGGARVNSGPPPDPNALRRDRPSDKDGWTSLPREREGDVPAWPLSGMVGKDDDASLTAMVAEREVAHWSRLWRTPQSVVWERNGWSTDVALYARWLALAELGDLKAGSEARQWSDRLGLNPAAMLRNRWRVVTDEVAPRRESARPVAVDRSASMRDRLRAVNGGGS